MGSFSQIWNSLEVRLVDFMDCAGQEEETLPLPNKVPLPPLSKLSDYVQAFILQWASWDRAGNRWLVTLVTQCSYICRHLGGVSPIIDESNKLLCALVPWPNSVLSVLTGSNSPEFQARPFPSPSWEVLGSKPGTFLAYKACILPLGYGHSLWIFPF